MKRLTQGFALALLLVCSVGLFTNGGFSLPVIGPGEIDRVTYVYEKDQGATPAEVSVALNKLNSRGIFASEFEKDTKDGTGETPEQYQVALKAAKEAGLPCLVIQSGETVVDAVNDPRKESDVLEAVE